MRVGIIGFGSAGARHRQNLKEFTKDIIILSKRKDIAGGHVVSNWNSFSKKSPFDAIFITNETYKHLPTIHKCLELSPKALFIEKPVSHTSRGLKQISKELKERGISAWVGYNLQFYKPFIYIREFIKKGGLGRIYYMRVFAGQDLKMWRERDYGASYSAKRLKGGGVILDLVHDINYPSWMLGSRLNPQFSIIKKVSTLKIDCEDIAESLFLSDKGAIVSVHQDYLRKEGLRSCELIGAKGDLSWDFETGEIRIKTGFKKEKIKIKEDANLMYKRELAYFFSKLKSKKFFSNIDEAVNDVFIIDFLKKNAGK